MKKPLLLVVALALSPAALAGDKEDLTMQSAVGIVSEVRPKDKQVVLKLRKDGNLTLTADDRSRIDFPGTDGKLANLKEGKRVRVTYYVKDGTNRLLSLTEPVITIGKIRDSFNLAMTFAKSASFKDRDEYKKNVQTIIQDLDDRIDALEARSEAAEGDARKALAREKEDVRRQRDQLRDKLSKVDAASEENWKEVRDGVNTVLTEVQRSLERARERDPGKDRQ
jgi:hypothetical protein